MTKVFEINVPEQKNLGGLCPVCISATIHGNEPRGKFSPCIMRFEVVFGNPQVSLLAPDRLLMRAEDSATNAHIAITIKTFLNIATSSQFITSLYLFDQIILALCRTFKQKQQRSGSSTILN